MSWLTRFMDPGAGYRDAQGELDKYNQQAQQYYQQAQQRQQPYANYGQDAHADYNAAMHALMNPQALHDKWASGYHESEAAKQLEEMAKQHGLSAANSMGLDGSSTAVNAIQAGTTQIGAQERDNYMKDLMQKYMAATGIAGNMFNTGANAAANMGNNDMNMGRNAMEMGNQAANMKFNQTNAPGDLFGKIMGQGVGLVGSYLTGGMSNLGNFNNRMPQQQRDAPMQPWRIQ